MNSEFRHQSVLLEEAVTALAVKADGLYVDATFGRGGHTQAIMAELGNKGRMVAVDQDMQAIDYGKQSIKDERLMLIHGNFAKLQDLLTANGINDQLDGVLMDLGVSSPQLDDAERGFSFMRNGPLDMRMDQSQGLSAKDWINSASVDEMAQVFRDYGEERHSKRIARAIEVAREKQPIETTGELSNLIAEAQPSGEVGKHPATRCFQAIRIYINEELTVLQQALQQAWQLLAIGGRLVVISFHSLEDRITKRFMKKLAKGDDFPADLPIKADQIKQHARIIVWGERANKDQLATNPRARSAVLRAMEKLA